MSLEATLDELCECGRGPKVQRRGCSAALAGCIECNLMDGNGRAQHDIIMMLRIAGEPQSTQYIAQEYGKTRNVIWPMLKRMEQKGLLRRTIRDNAEDYERAAWGGTKTTIAKAAQAFWSPAA